MKTRFPFLKLLLFFSLLWMGCGKDDDGIAETKNKLIVTPDFENGFVDISWESETLSTFEKYILVRSLDSLPDQVAPPPQSWGTELYEFEVRNQLTFKDEELPRVGHFYYQLYIDLGTHYTRSKIIKVKNPKTGVSNLTFRGCVHLPESDYLFLSSHNTLGIIKYNLKTELIEANRGNYSSQFYKLFMGDAGQGQELFVFNLQSSFSALDPESLMIKQQVQLELSPGHLSTSKTGYTFFAHGSINFPSNQISVVQRSDWDIKTAENSVSGAPFISAFLDIENDIIIDASTHHMYLRSLQTDGHLTTIMEKNIDLGLDYTELKEHIAISPDGNLFMPYKSAMAFNADLELVKQNDLKSLCHLFSSDGNYIYAGGTGSVTVLNNSDFSIKETIFLEDNEAVVTHLFEIDNELVIVAHISNGGDINSDVLIIKKTL